ncbi:MAG: ATP synthase F1 subunit delta, partial [Candidatus Dadabacteria bacterium]
NKDLQYVFNSPLVSEREKMSIIEEIAKKVWHNELFINFSKLLAQNKRLSFLKEISDAFEELVNEKKRRGVVYVFSARELSQQEKEKVLSCVVSSLKGSLAVEDVQVVWEVDPSILAGIVLRIGDKIFDGSLAGELKALRETLLQ